MTNPINLTGSLKNVQVDLKVVLLQQKLSIGELLQLKEQSTLVFHKPAQSPIYLSLNGQKFAAGKLIRMNDYYGFEITDIQ